MILVIGGGSVSGTVRSQILCQHFLKSNQEVCVISYLPDEFLDCNISLRYSEKPTTNNILGMIPKEILDKVTFITSVFDVYIDIVGFLNDHLNLQGINFEVAKVLKSKTKSVSTLCESHPESFELLPFYTTIPKNTPVILKPESGTGSIRYNEHCYATVENLDLIPDLNSTFGGLVAQKKWLGDQTIFGLNYYFDGEKLHDLFMSNIEKDETYQLLSLKKVLGECPDLSNWEVIKGSPFGLFFNIQCFFNRDTNKFVPFDVNSRFSAVTHECINLIYPKLADHFTKNIKTTLPITEKIIFPGFEIRQTKKDLPEKFVPILNKVPNKNDLTYRPPISCYVGDDYDKTPVESK